MEVDIGFLFCVSRLACSYVRLNNFIRGSLCNCNHPGHWRMWVVGPGPQFVTPLRHIPWLQQLVPGLDFVDQH